MPIVVRCGCGKRFAAKDHLFGRRMPCPACGTSLLVAHDAEVESQGVYVSCKCGRAFMAPESMRGEEARCKGCGRAFYVPGRDPIDIRPDPVPKPRNRPVLSQAPVSSDDSEIPWDTLKRIGMIGGSVLLVLIVLTTIRNNWHRRPKVEHLAEIIKAAPRLVMPPARSDDDDAETGRAGDALAADLGSGFTAPLDIASPLDSGLPKGEAEDTSPLTAPLASITGGQEPPAASVLSRLPHGVEDWHAQSGARLSGIRRVNPTDPPIAHFSWMTSLLPYIGHGQLYQQFDFKQPLTKGKNLQLGAVIVPEFLNPLDEQQRWKGYPFEGIALTHVVGISGIEDARNVVAAKLPRSDPRAGVFGYDEIARPEEITDGQSQTIMIAGAGALSNPWVFGGGATIRGAREPLFDKTSGLGMKGLPGGGSMVVMADGSVRHVTADIDPRVFKAMCTIRGGESVDVHNSTAPFAWEILKAP